METSLITLHSLAFAVPELFELASLIYAYDVQSAYCTKGKSTFCYSMTFTMYLLNYLCACMQIPAQPFGSWPPPFKLPVDTQTQRLILPPGQFPVRIATRARPNHDRVGFPTRGLLFLSCQLKSHTIHIRPAPSKASPPLSQPHRRRHKRNDITPKLQARATQANMISLLLPGTLWDRPDSF